MLVMFALQKIWKLLNPTVVNLLDLNGSIVHTATIDTTGKTTNTDTYGEPLIKNILERVFLGIFITLFEHEMGDGNYYHVLKVNSNSSQYDVTSPMEKSKTDFNNMSEWLDSWRQTEFSCGMVL